MKKILVSMLVLMLTAASFGGEVSRRKIDDEGDATKAYEIGATIPNLTWKHSDGGAPIDVTLDELIASQKVVMLEYSQVWCGPCNTAAPHLEALWQEYGGMGNEKLYVCAALTEINQNANDLSWDQLNGSTWRGKHSITHWLAMSELYSYASDFGVGGIPDAVLIGNGNRLMWKGHPMNVNSAIIEEVYMSYFFFVENDIENQNLDFEETVTIDLANTFNSVAGNDITISIESNSNEASLTATLSGTTLTLAAGSTVGNAEIVIKGDDGEHSATTSFTTVVSDPAAVTIFEEGFEGGSIPDTWTAIDSDGDSNNWLIGEAPGINVHSGEKCITSQSYANKGALTPDNWIITPQISITDGKGAVNYWVSAQDADWAGEHYGVYVSTTGTATADFELLFEETMVGKASGQYYERNVSLGDRTGDMYVAFRHFDCTDMFQLNIDDIKVIKTTGGGIEDNSKVVDFTLQQNYPNPFNPETSISFNLKNNATVSLTVFNTRGESVASLIKGQLSAGTHKVNFNAAHLNSGVYYYSLESATGKMTKKMLLVK